MAPIDVWIQRLIDEDFGGRDPFPSYGQQAGIVQQYLFYYKRSTRRSVAHKKRKSQHIFAKKIKKFQTQAAKAVEKTASADRKPRISRG